MGMTFAAFGALAGPPVSGVVNRATGGYAAVGYYAGKTFPIIMLTSFRVDVDVDCVSAGSVLLLSCMLLLTTRHLVLKRLWGKF